MKSAIIATALLASSASAYPFMANYHKMSEEQKRDLTGQVQARGVGSLPRVDGHLAKRSGAEPYSSQYPYTGAKIDGLPGTQIGGQQVPAPGDTAHQYQDPPAGAQRGPCPGLNTAANHGFISRDGITTFNELVAAQQNIYNVGWDLAVVLATAGVGLDGDILTMKVSIGGDATSQTASLPGQTEGGLDTHLKFEGDASLTRNDYYLANGDNHSFNGTLFAEMTKACNGYYSRDCLSAYRKQRWQESQSTNPHFFFGPGALLLYGAQSFLYELFPGQGGQPDKATIESFFGAVDNGDGTYGFQGERIPPNWYSRKDPYTGPLVTAEILASYLENPVPFGGNAGAGDFLGLNFTGVTNGQYKPASASDISCLIQNFLLGVVPSTIQNTALAPLKNLLFIAEKINPQFAQIGGCPAVTPQ